MKREEEISVTINNKTLRTPARYVKKHFDAVVEFYRTKLQADGEEGDDDELYTGSFGFDRFSDDTMADGWITSYEVLDGVKRDKKNISDNYAYLAPYLTIWPPKSVGNEDSSKSKVTIFCKAEKEEAYNRKSLKNTKVTLGSSQPDCVKITSNEEIELEIGGEAVEIELECLKAFSKDIHITAQVDEKVIGLLIIPSNNVIYKTTLLHYGLDKSKLFNDLKYYEEFYKNKFKIRPIPKQYKKPKLINNASSYCRSPDRRPLDKRFVIAKKGRKYGVLKMDYEPEEILPFEYSKITGSIEYLILEKKRLKCYYPISKIPRYKQLEPFTYYFAKFKLPDGRWGWLGKDGKEYIQEKNAFN